MYVKLFTRRKKKIMSGTQVSEKIQKNILTAWLDK